MGIVLRFVILSLVLFELGCKRPIDNPELIDPIFGSLKSEAKRYEGLAKDKKAEVEKAKREWDEAKPQTGRIRAAKERYYSKVRELEMIEQMIKYFKLRAESRKRDARKEYAEAFNKDLPWPDPKKFEAFELELRAKNASKIWDARVPKWNDRKIAYKKSVEAKNEASKKASGGGEAKAEH